jgi:hypothetical protein
LRLPAVLRRRTRHGASTVGATTDTAAAPRGTDAARGWCRGSLPGCRP